MKLEGEQSLLRIHMSNFAKWHTGPLYEALVERARHDRLAGATALSGSGGYVNHGPMLGEHPRALQVEHPVVVEIVDEEARLRQFLEAVEPMLGKHVLVTLERAHVVHYRGGEEGAPVMIRTTEGTLLRIFIGDSDRFEGQPLHKALVQRAHALGLAGATVLHGPLGFGRHSRMHNAKIAEIPGDLPVVIELVDSDEAIAKYMVEVDALVREGLVTLEKVRIVSYGKAEQG